MEHLRNLPSKSGLENLVLNPIVHLLHMGCSTLEPQSPGKAAIWGLKK